MTFSLAARCTRTGMFGAVVTSSSPAVAARCIYARAGVGAACTQNITDPRLGSRLLDLLEAGSDANEALGETLSSAPFVEYRQLTVVDKTGVTAAYSGTETLGTHDYALGKNAVAAGNLLAYNSVPHVILERFTELENEHLGARLIAALRAGLDAGGEAGPIHSAGLLLVDEVPWPVADLRVDWSDDPIGELEKLWALWQPQMDAYVTRALNPSGAPSYGVPGDE
jgi:uncharacterized Ntn-hydrolase superfamily protein